MQILYVSASCSQRLANKLFEETHRDPGFQIVKFTRLLLEGFCHNDACVVSLCGISARTKRFFWKEPNEVIQGVRYQYIPFVNLIFIRQLCVQIGAFFKTLSWIIRTRKQSRNRIIIHDVLANSACSGSKLAADICHVPTCALVTDMPGFSAIEKAQNKKGFYNHFLHTRTKQILNRINSYSSYILLTEQMNSLINTKHRPYVVMEGLVDTNALSQTQTISKEYPRVILYAGALVEQYGVKAMVDAVLQSSHSDIELHLYGDDKDSGFAKYLRSCEARDKRIVYKGVAKNEDIVKAEQSASLLVNPRFTNQEITKYSFPSKNMEYMVSGTPLLTTRLPGMPAEYNDYVYLFDEETTEGYAKKIDEIMNLSPADLQYKGKAAKEFVLKEKNHIKQAQRVITMFKTVVYGK